MSGGVPALYLPYAMALCFPPLPRALDIAPASDRVAATPETIAARLHAALDGEWWMFRDRVIANRSAPLVLLHRRHGIAVALSDAAPRDLVVEFRRLLDEAGFSETFRGVLPIVTVDLADLASGAPGDIVAVAFRDAPTLSIDDPDWVEWVADQLTVESDLVPTAALPAAAAETSGDLIMLLPPDDDTAFARPDAPSAAARDIPPRFAAPAPEGPSAASPRPDPAAQTPPIPRISIGHGTDGNRRRPAAVLAGIVGLGSVALASVALALSTIPSATRERAVNADRAAASSEVRADDVLSLAPAANVLMPARVEAAVIPLPAPPAPAGPEGRASSGRQPGDGGSAGLPSASPEAAPSAAEGDGSGASAEQQRKPSRRRAQASRSSRPVAAEAPSSFHPWREWLRPRPGQPHINRNQP
jgi:hypothetical protein